MAGGAVGPIYERLSQAGGYHPFTAETFADWSVQAGDVVKIQKNGEEYEAPIYTSHMVWRGSTPQTTFETTGNTERESISKLGERRYGSSADGASLSGGYSGGGYRSSGIAGGRMAQAEEAISMALWDIKDMEKQYTSQFNMTAHQIDLVSAVVNENGSILQQAGLSLNAQGVLIYAEDALMGNGSPISAEFSVQADRIQSVVNKTGVEDPQWDDSKTLFTRVRQTESDISAEYSRAVGAENTMNAKISVNENGISTLVAKSGINDLGEGQTLYSKISQNESSIGLVVSNGSIDAASIVIAVNARTGAGTVKINASQVDLGSYATVEALNGVEASFKKLTVDGSRVNNLYAVNFVGNNLTTAYDVTVGRNLSVTGNLGVTGTLSFSQDGGSVNVHQRVLKMTGITTRTLILSPNASPDVDLSHAHSMSVDSDGVVTIGDAVQPNSQSATFNIADTAYFQRQMSAKKLEGWNAAATAIVWPSGLSENAISITYPVAGTLNSTTAKGYQMEPQPSWQSDHTKYVFLKPRNSDGSLGNAVARTLVYATDIYYSGWNAAAGQVHLPDPNTNSSNMWFHYPVADAYDSSDYSVYSMLQETSGGKLYVSTKLNNEDGTFGSTVARLEVNTSSLESDAERRGWNNAAGSIVWPGEGTGNSIGIVYPVTGGTTTTKTYLFTQGSFDSTTHKKYVYWRQDTAQGDAVARTEVDASGIYTDGWNDAAAKVKWPSADTGSAVSIEYPVSGGTYTTKAYLLTQGAWSAGKKYVYLRPDTAQTSAVARVEVDASSMLTTLPNITSNGTYNASTYGYSGFSSVTVAVPSSSYVASDLHISKSGGNVLLYLGNHVVERTASIAITSLKKSSYSNAYNITVRIDGDTDFTFSKLPD